MSGLGISSLVISSLVISSLVIGSFGIATWVQLIGGIRLVLGHGCLAELSGFLHVLGNSYRLASTGVGSTVVYGRFAAGFCRAAIAALLQRARYSTE